MRFLLLALTWIPLLCAAPQNLFVMSAAHHGLLPAKEALKYMYLATGELPELIMVEAGREKAAASTLFKSGRTGLVLASTEADPLLSAVLGSPESSELSPLISDVEKLRSTNNKDAHMLRMLPESSVGLCVGTGRRSLLYSVYSAIQQVTPIRFRLHGDVIPDLKQPLKLQLNADFAPTFSVRGIQPFHDFSEGPDWWNEQEYKLHFAQMAKLKMNFMGLHTYPVSEPTVWTGLSSDVNPDGTVKSGYPTAYMNSLRGGDWGGTPMPTSLYPYGLKAAFSQECYGSDANMANGTCPQPASDDPHDPIAEALFNNVAKMFRNAFTYAKSTFDHLTCVGTEAPLARPPHGPQVSTQEYYEGIFTRVAAAYPIDYYWIWTSEGWPARQNKDIPVSDPVISSVVDDMIAAHQARVAVGSKFQLATNGWTVGPMVDRAYFDKVLPDDYTITSINEVLGHTDTEPEYATITHHPKWAIPWMEDDPGLTGVQLWVARTIRYCASALRMNSTGCLGIHWRTQEISPQLSALAALAWNPSLTVEDVYTDLVQSEFGLSGAVVQKIAAIFVSIDSYIGDVYPPPLVYPSNIAVPRPDNWIGGPGMIAMNSNPFDPKPYQFVDDFCSYQTQVSGVNNLDRFAWWCNFFKYLRSMGQVGCAWGALDVAIQKGKTIKDPDQLKAFFTQTIIPLRISLVQSAQTLSNFLTQIVATTGTMGTIANIVQHSFDPILNGTLGNMIDLFAGCKDVYSFGCFQDTPPRVFPVTITISSPDNSHEWCARRCDTAGYNLAGVEFGVACFCAKAPMDPKIVPLPASDCTMPCAASPSEQCGGSWALLVYNFSCSTAPIPPIPPAAYPSWNFTGTPRLFSLTPISSTPINQPLTITVVVFSSQLLAPPVLHWRKMGGSSYTDVTMQPVSSLSGRLVFSASLTPAYDIEYAVDTTSAPNSVPIQWPAGGRQSPHAVVVY